MVKAAGGRRAASLGRYFARPAEAQPPAESRAAALRHSPPSLRGPGRRSAPVVFGDRIACRAPRAPIARRTPRARRSIGARHPPARPAAPGARAPSWTSWATEMVRPGSWHRWRAPCRRRRAHTPLLLLARRLRDGLPQGRRRRDGQAQHGPQVLPPAAAARSAPPSRSQPAPPRPPRPPMMTCRCLPAAACRTLGAAGQRVQPAPKKAGKKSFGERPLRPGAPSLLHRAPGTWGPASC
jgi:hypothetical protein